MIWYSNLAILEQRLLECLTFCMSLPRDRVAVVGAGVIGLSTAVRLAEAQPEASVEVIADAFEHETTSSGAAGLWEPYKLSDTPAARIRSWGADTFDFLQVLTSSDFRFQLTF